MSLSDLVSLVCMPRSGIAGSYGSSISRPALVLFPLVGKCFCEYRGEQRLSWNKIPLAEISSLEISRLLGKDLP